MAHFAKLNSDNIVVAIKTVANAVIENSDGTESETKGQDFLNALHGQATWVQCSYNGNIRKRYPRVGDKYDSARDAFIVPKPHESWTLDETTCRWQPPVPYPSDALEHEVYEWDEDNQQWNKL